MADDAARSRLGRGLAALIGDVGAEVAVDRARAAQPAQGADRVRARQSAQSAQAVLRRRARRACRPRSASAASSSRSWCARARRATISRSSPASGAGARRSAPACTRCRSSCSTSATARRSSLRSSRTCSAPISIRWKRRAAISRSPTSSIISQDDIAKIVGKSRSHVANTLRLLKLPERGEGLHQFRQAHRRPRAHAGRPAERRRAGATRSSTQGLNVRQVEAMARKSGTAAGASRRKRTRAARQGRRHAWRWRSGCPMRSGCWSRIDHRANGGGMLQVRYRTLEQLDDVVAAAGSRAED